METTKRISQRAGIHDYPRTRQIREAWRGYYNENPTTRHHAGLGYNEMPLPRLLKPEDSSL